jgi:hypothetical protein
MAEGVLYLDVDDEITSAAARIRRAEGGRVVLVLPYGSKVATSRINFRLLARDALTHEKRLSIVAPDGATRALAASAGLPVFASVAEYESSLEDGRSGGARGGIAAGAVAAARARAAAPGAGDEPLPGDAQPDEFEEAPASDPTVVMAVPAGAVGAAGIPAPPVRTAPSRTAEPAAKRGFSIPVIGSGRSIRTPLIIGAGIVALALLVGGVGAYVLLPSA